jgi:zinc/manganese transport system substrate-binding protein
VLNQADVLLEGGAELEIGWLPRLVDGARNAKILGDAPGHVILSRGIRLLEVPTGPVDRSQGDVHPLGNPHYSLDPGNGKIIAGTLAEAFGKIDPSNAAFFEANLKRFNERLDKKIAEWTKALEPYRGTKVVTYHKSLTYFLERFGFELAGHDRTEARYRTIAQLHQWAYSTAQERRSKTGSGRTVPSTQAADDRRTICGSEARVVARRGERQ